MKPSANFAGVQQMEKRETVPCSVKSCSLGHRGIEARHATYEQPGHHQTKRQVLQLLGAAGILSRR